ncbi:MAG: hypothetical protein K6343_06180 [Caldisericaceae bacterium]
MKRFFLSIRFQLIFVLLFFITTVFFIISTNISDYLLQNELANQSSRINIIVSQVEERYEKFYEAESFLRGYNSISPSLKRVYINVFLKPLVDNYFSTISTVYSNVGLGYYIPVFDEPFHAVNTPKPLTKNLIIVSAIPDSFGGGYIFAAVPYERINSNVKGIVLKINRLVFYLAFITVIIVLLITSFFNIRILSLRRGLKKLETDLDFKFPKYGGEIGDIADSINSMALSLKRNIEEIKRTEALKSLGLFTAGIVHEIRNPLTSIKGFASILSQKLKGKDEERYVITIINESERLQRIADDLLKYGRPSPLSFSKFNLKPFFTHIVEVAKHYDEKKNIEFKLNCSDIFLVADARKLEELFLNLVINAVQAIDKNLGYVEINCLEEKNHVRIEIIDNGSGIDEKNLKDIFVPFFTTKSSGTGLGLAIAYRIIEEHGGEIFVESKVGIGTKFTVVLPKRES